MSVQRAMPNQRSRPRGSALRAHARTRAGGGSGAPVPLCALADGIGNHSHFGRARIAVHDVGGQVRRIRERPHAHEKDKPHVEARQQPEQQESDAARHDQLVAQVEEKFAVGARARRRGHRHAEAADARERTHHPAAHRAALALAVVIAVIPKGGPVAAFNVQRVSPSAPATLHRLQLSKTRSRLSRAESPLTNFVGGGPRAQRWEVAAR